MKAAFDACDTSAAREAATRAAASQPSEREIQWRELWKSRADALRNAGHSVNVGSNWATVRNVRGQLLGMFLVGREWSEIDYALAQLQLDKVQT